MSFGNVASCGPAGRFSVSVFPRTTTANADVDVPTGWSTPARQPSCAEPVAGSTASTAAIGI